MTISSRRSTPRRGLRILLATAMVLGVLGSASTQANPNPLAVSVSASSNPVASGQSLTYTIVVTNTEPDLKNVGLTDQLYGLTNIVLTSTRGYCFEDNLLITCDAGSMPGHNSMWVVTIRGLVTASNGETLNNTAIATAKKSSQTFAVPATTQVLVSNPDPGTLPDLSVSIAAPDDAPLNSEAIYTLTVNNAGGANATDVKLVATLPSGFGVNGTTATSLFDCAVVLPTVTCTGGAVNAGANATVTIKVLTSGTPERYKVTAKVDPEDAIGEGNELNNTASHEIFLPAGPLPTEPIEFSKSGPSFIRAGDTLTYTIRVANTSSRYTADRLKVVDGTQGLDAASVTATSTNPKLICTPSASQVVCNATNGNFRLDKLQTVVVTISGRVVNRPGTLINNTAVLETTQNKIFIVRRQTVATTVRPGIDLTVTQYARCDSMSAPVGLSGGTWGNCPFRARDEFNYLITVGNSGLDDAMNVKVREPLSPGVVFEGFSGPAGVNCTVDGTNVVTCTGLDVPGDPTAVTGGNIRQIVLHLTAPNQTGPITDTVTVDPFNAIFEDDETNNSATTTTGIATGIDLTIMKTMNFDPVAPSGTLVYDVQMQNIGTQDASGIKMTDILPAGTRFRSAKEVPNLLHAPYAPPHGFSCGHDGSATGGVVTCTGGRLLGTYAFNGGPPWQPPALVDTVTIEITLFAPAPVGFILNQALVDPDNTIPEINENNDLTILETDVQIPVPIGTAGTYHEFTVQNEQTNPAGGAPVAPNGTLQYTLTMKNWGSDPAFNVSVLDVIPVGSRFRSANSSPLVAGSGGFICAYNAGVVQCGSGALAAGGSATIVIKLFAPDAPTVSSNDYTNHAVMDPNNDIPEADETNNVSDVVTTVTVGGANAYNQLTLTNDQAIPIGGGAVAPSGTLIYRLNIGNTGSDVTQQVVLRDYLPEGTRFRSAKNNVGMSTAGSGGFACFHSDGIVECRNGTLQAAGMAVIDVLLFAPAQTGIINNQAIVDPDNEIPEGNEQDNAATSADTTVSLSGTSDYFELSISALTDTPDPVATDTPITYQLSVKNDGSDEAFNVSVENYLPAATTFVSANDNAPGAGAFTCSEAGGTVSCTGGHLPAGGSRTIDIIARSPRQSDVTLVNNQVNITDEARVDPNNDLPEGDETNNSNSTVTSVLAKVNLSVTNEGSDCSGKSGNECNWTFDVTNGGPDAVSDVVVRTDLPVGVIPLNVEGPAEWACQITENAINQVTCTRPDAMSATTESFTIRVYVTANTGNSLTSTTIADPDGTIVETDEGDNTATDTESA